MPEENTLLVQVANDIRRATERCKDDETESISCRDYVMELNEREKGLLRVGLRSMKHGWN